MVNGGNSVYGRWKEAAVEMSLNINKIYKEVWKCGVRWKRDNVRYIVNNKK